VALVEVVIVDHDLGKTQGDGFHRIIFAVAGDGIATYQAVFQSVGHVFNDLACTSLYELDDHFLARRTGYRFLEQYSGRVVRRLGQHDFTDGRTSRFTVGQVARLHGNATTDTELNRVDANVVLVTFSSYIPFDSL